MILTGNGPQSETLIGHLDKFVIREDVVFADLTEEYASVFICGKQAGDLLNSAGCMMPERNQLIETSLGAVNLQLAHWEIAGWGGMLLFPIEERENVFAALTEAGIVQCSSAALNVVRVEQGTPWFGVDIDESNLPQELQRDEKAINFNKGCYLGQETVARIDARGRVNQLFVKMKFDDPVEVGTELIDNEKVVGKVTSVSGDDKTDQTLGLGFVKRNFQKVGTVVGDATVI